MRVILIDPATKTVVEANRDTRFDALQDAVRGSIEIAHYFDNGDVLYVNGNGLLELEDALKGETEIERAYLFDLQAHQPFAGRGIIVGEEVDGVHQDAKTTLEEVRSLISFPAPAELVPPSNTTIQ